MTFIILLIHISLKFVAKDSNNDMPVLDQGRRLLKLRFLISPLAKISILQKYLLDSLNHIHVWHVSQQLSCGDTCQV